jgi:uncharacterized metal-binding protein YceD (DUF177 family)
MGYLKQFDIPFAGLPLGSHEYQYVIDKKFFDEFDYSLIKEGNAIVDLVLNKHSTLLLLTFNIKSNIDVSCDRCLIQSSIPLEQTFELVVKFGEQNRGEDGVDELVLSESETEINIAAHICECVNLMLPLNIVACELTGNTKLCNVEVLERLEQLKTPEQEQIIDPRWEALNKLKKN